MHNSNQHHWVSPWYTGSHTKKSLLDWSVRCCGANQRIICSWVGVVLVYDRSLVWKWKHLYGVIYIEGSHGGFLGKKDISWCILGNANAVDVIGSLNVFWQRRLAGRKLYLDVFLTQCCVIDITQLHVGWLETVSRSVSVDRLISALSVLENVNMLNGLDTPLCKYICIYIYTVFNLFMYAPVIHLDCVNTCKSVSDYQVILYIIYNLNYIFNNIDVNLFYTKVHGVFFKKPLAF